MNESKIDATDRLRREGRWSEASRFKDEAICRLRAEGRKAEANDIAWAEMIAAFPPLPVQTKPQTLDSLDITSADRDLVDRLAAVPVNWQRDMLWVYQVFAHPAVELADAPSLAAWGLLRFAREEKQKFFGMLVSLLAPKTKAKPATEDESTDDPGLADLEKMLRQ